MRIAAFYLVGLFLIPHLSSAHHSSAGVYNADEIVEIEGVVTSVIWRNPHTFISIAVADGAGTSVEWRIETGAITTLRTRGLDREFIEVGDKVQVAGESSTRNRPEMFARNLLLQDGREVLLTSFSKPRWTIGRPGDLLEAEFDERVAEEARRSAEGIFRAWSTVIGDPDSFPMIIKDGYPLTEDAAAEKAKWNPRADPLLNCEPKGMPQIMSTPFPIEFIRAGDNIVLRLEEDDSQRLIYINPKSGSEASGYSRLGDSTGRWDGSVLVVETRRISAPYFFSDGTPQTRNIELVERFEPSDDWQRLDYVMTVTDPEVFTESFELRRYWIWRPELRVETYNCEPNDLG